MSLINIKGKNLWIQWTLGLVVILLIVFLYINKNNFYQNNKLNLPSPTDIDLSNLCPKNLKIPNGYNEQNPINSFYGITLKKGEGKICQVLLGPNYKIGYEGFSGEQIQINVYSKELTTLEKIRSEDSLESDHSTESFIRYTKHSYGGNDEVILINGKNTIFQIIWRVESSDAKVTNTALEIAEELQNQ